MKSPFEQQFNLAKLIKFAFPSIIMMMFLSMYSIVDGVFISRYAGTTALSSVNMVYPFISIIFAVGLMFGTGGNAIIGKNLGENKP